MVENSYKVAKLSKVAKLAKVAKVVIVAKLARAPARNFTRSQHCAMGCRN
jgi:hypothetical protein